MRRNIMSLALGVFLIAAASGRAQAQTLSDLNSVLGGIANAYGTLQGAQFVLSLLGIGTDISMQTAVNELESFIQNYRDTELINNVNADVTEFQGILMNPNNTDMEDNWINDALRDLTNLQGDIQNGSMSDAYILAPAFNTLSVLYAAALKSFTVVNPANFSYSSAYTDSFLITAFQVDYSLIGAGLVNYDVFTFGGPQYMFTTQGGKVMWPQYSGAYWEYSPFTCSGLTESILCVNSEPGNSDSDMFVACSCAAEYGLERVPLTSLSLNPSASMAAAKALIDQNRTAFFQDTSVAAVLSTEWNLFLFDGINPQIVDWGDNWFGISAGHVVFP